MRELTITSNIKQATSTPLCGCTHHDWLTCWARQHHTSRFNALFISETPTVHLSGKCACLCHQDENKQQISERAWQMVVAQDNSKKTRAR